MPQLSTLPEGRWTRTVAHTGRACFRPSSAGRSADCVGGATIAFPESDGPDRPRADDAYGDGPSPGRPAGHAIALASHARRPENWRAAQRRGVRLAVAGIMGVGRSWTVW